MVYHGPANYTLTYFEDAGKAIYVRNYESPYFTHTVSVGHQVVLINVSHIDARKF